MYFVDDIFSVMLDIMEQLYFNVSLIKTTFLFNILWYRCN